jgi:hypothetical protein
MAFSHTITYSWGNGNASLQQSQSKSAGAELNIEESIPNASTDLQVACAFDVSKVESIMILSDQNVTLETNSGGSPANTINLLANVPYVWQKATYLANLFTTNVTSWFLTNSSGANATLKARILTDPT